VAVVLIHALFQLHTFSDTKSNQASINHIHILFIFISVKITSHTNLSKVYVLSNVECILHTPMHNESTKNVSWLTSELSDELSSSSFLCLLPEGLVAACEALRLGTCRRTRVDALISSKSSTNANKSPYLQNNNATITINNYKHKTREVAVDLGTHCNIGSRSAAPLRVILTLTLNTTFTLISTFWDSNNIPIKFTYSSTFTQYFSTSSSFSTSMTECPLFGGL